MIRAGSGSSKLPSPGQAAEAACAAALAAAGIDRADAALLFAAGQALADPFTLLETAAAALGTPAVVGGSAEGLVVVPGSRAGAADESSGVVVLALSGLQTEPILLAGLAGREPGAGAEILATVGGTTTARDLVVVLPDALTLDGGALVAGLRQALGPALLVGAGTTPGAGGQAFQWCGEEVASGAVAALVLRGARPPRVGVTQSCQPTGDAATVTRSEGHWVLELDGRPALDVYREVARGPLAAELRRAAAFVLVALPRGPEGALTPGSYLVRHVAGFDEARRAFALPEPVAKGRRVGFVLRDAAAARDDLAAMLAGLAASAPSPPVAGLYLDCCARGPSLFGVEGLEAGYLERALPGVPVAGLLGGFEIGPIGGTPELLTYTGVLALLDDEPA